MAKIVDRRWNPLASASRYEICKANYSAGTPYMEEAFEGHLISVAYDGNESTFRHMTIGIIAKRKCDGLWATAMIGSGWHNNKGHDRMSMHDAVMSGVGYPTAWQAMRKR